MRAPSAWLCIALLWALSLSLAAGCGGPSLPSDELPTGPDEPGINLPSTRQPGVCQPGPGREDRSSEQMGLDAALWKAQRFCDPGASKGLILAGGDVNATCGKNLTTPLMEAVRQYDNKCPTKAAETIIKAGAAINMQDRVGNTALHWVAGQNCDKPHIEALDMLLRYGADPTITDCPDCAGCRECRNEHDCREYQARRDQQSLMTPSPGETPEQKDIRMQELERLQDEIDDLRDEREGGEIKNVRQCKTPLDLALESKCDPKMGILADQIRKLQVERKRLMGPSLEPLEKDDEDQDSDERRKLPKPKKPFLESAPWDQPGN